MPMAQKKDSRPAKSSTSMPLAVAVLTYSLPSASVKASSSAWLAPASCMWWPEIEIELNLGMFRLVYSMMSPMMRIDGWGGGSEEGRVGEEGRSRWAPDHL